ncbi:hypothetical protein STPH1_0002 [Streptomyces sp. OM5714]|nr:hypothetical protein STPH1_0002 [Streptomyces sp. OM5714]
MTPPQRGQYLRFRWRILPAEVQPLLQTASAILDEHGIDEPVQWSPHLDDATMSTLRLPGPEPDSINAAGLHRAVPGGDLSIARLAQTSHTTTAHAIYLLSQHGRLERTEVSPHPVHRHRLRAVAHLVRRRPLLPPGHRGHGRHEPGHGAPGTAQVRLPAPHRRVSSRSPSQAYLSGQTSRHLAPWDRRGVAL